MKLLYTEHEVYHNVKEEIYPTCIRSTVCTKPIFKDKNYELTKPIVRERRTSYNTDNPVRDDSVLRAKRKVFDISMLNQFDYFVTWTLDKRKINRYDKKVIKQKLLNFLSNLRQRYNAKYLLIPEYHKDGAIHMHGLFTGDFKLIDSGFKTKDGKTIYNMPQWSYGFSTAIKISGDYSNVCKYITKYVEKDFKKIFGKFYYSGGDLIREPIKKYYNIDFNAVEAPEFYCKEANLSFKYVLSENIGDDETKGFDVDFKADDYPECNIKS